MKRYFKNIIATIITVAMTVIGLQKVGLLLDPAWSKDGFDVIHAFHSLDENSLDVIVYGSSHAWKGFDTRVLNDKYGISAYNYGCNWQAMNTVELFLEDSLRTQTPKVVCIETFTVNNVLNNTNMDGQIYYTKAMDNFDGKKKYLQQCFGNKLERYASYYFPIIMFHDNWNCISSENFLDQGYERFIRSTGFMETNRVYPFSMPNYQFFSQSELSPIAIETLNNIVNICNSKGIHVIFYTCPYDGEFNYSNALNEYAQKNNCDYIDLFRCYQDLNLDGSSDFNDGGHLNDSGAAKVADYLGKYITENFNL